MKMIDSLSDRIKIAELFNGIAINHLFYLNN